jgi:hypothetical protein
MVDSLQTKLELHREDVALLLGNFNDRVFGLNVFQYEKIAGWAFTTLLA